MEAIQLIRGVETIQLSVSAKQMQTKPNHENHYEINFLAYLKLWDHSKILDLDFLILPLSTRAHQSFKTPHS